MRHLLTTTGRGCLAVVLSLALWNAGGSMAAASQDWPEDAAAANARLGRGINLGNMLEAPAEGEWGAKFQDHYAAEIRRAGFQHVRIPVRWSAHTAAAAPFAVDPQFLRRVRHVVDTCDRQKLHVVLNVHHFNELFDDPEQHSDRLKAIWKQISREFADVSPAVYFELLNEPHGKLSSENWNAMIPGLLEIVREHHPHRPVIIGGGNWNGWSALQHLRLPESDRMLIATFHYYLPFPFTHQGAPWTAPNVPPVGRGFPADPEEPATMREHFAQVRQWSAASGRPVYLGEFGAFQAAPPADRVRWTAAVQEMAAEHQFSSAYWEFCSGFGAYDPGTERWRDELLRALIPGSSAR